MPMASGTPLLVGPNSGYEQDNRCMLDAIANGRGRFKGHRRRAPNDIDDDALRALKAAGIVGVAFNATFHGVDYYRDAEHRCSTALAALDLCVSLQVQHEQLVVHRADVRALRRCACSSITAAVPRPSAGPDQPGFRTLLGLAATGRVFVKLSGYVKFAEATVPVRRCAAIRRRAARRVSRRIACMWASDWPFLRAPERIDYGPLLNLIERFVPDPVDRRRVLFGNAVCACWVSPVDTIAPMNAFTCAQILAGTRRPTRPSSLKGWVRTRRDSKAGISFVHVSDGSASIRCRRSSPEHARELRGRSRAPDGGMRGRGHRQRRALAGEGPAVRDAGDSRST